MAMAEDFNKLFNRPPYDPGFQYEDRFYMTDPKTDVLLFDGSKLENGMLVMIGEPSQRGKTPLNPAAHGTHDRFEATLYQVKVYNRWCYVSDLKIDAEPADGHWCRKRRVAFIGTYEDGAQVKHDHDLDHAWIVKKSSMIRHNLETDEEVRGYTSEEEAKAAWEKLQVDFPEAFAKMREYDEEHQIKEDPLSPDFMPAQHGSDESESKDH